MYKGEKVKIMGVGVIVERNGQILMIEEQLGMDKIGKESKMISYPLETVKSDESPLDAAVRGYKEEIGIDVSLTNIIGFYDFLGGFGISFSGTIKDESIELNPNEVANLKWMTQAEILASNRLRPGVRESIIDYFNGKNYSLDIITSVKK